jgi:hypothetical protein
MSKLTPGERAAIPSDQFAGPGRTFPIPDKGHARAAIQDAPHSEHVGNISPATEAAIVAKAERKLRGPKRASSAARSRRVGRA